MGYFLAPLDPPPLGLCKWRGRFDDSRREFRTLYCAETPYTSLYETLFSLRPSVKQREEFETKMGCPLVKPLSLKWRQKNVLLPGRINIVSGDLLSLKEPRVRSRLEDAPEVRDLLIRLKISKLDLGVILGSKRKVTQAIARAVYDWGEAGVLYPSKHDSCECAAIFEGKAYLVADGPPQPLTDNFPELIKVCRDLNFSL